MKRRNVEEEETPLPVVLGEWWTERRAEIGAMRRIELEKALVEAGVLREDEREMGFAMKWLRKRMAYREQVQFYLDRSLTPPNVVVAAEKRMDDPANRGKSQPWEVDFFLDARRAERSEAETKRLLKRGQDDLD